MRLRRRTIAIGIAGLGVVVLAACSSGQGTRDSSGGGSAAEPGGGKVNALNNAGARGTFGTSDQAATVPEPAKGAPDAGPGTNTSALIDTRSLIRTASISVRVKDISAADRVRVIAIGAGGQVDGDDRSTGDDASAALVLEVPPDKLNDVLTKFAALGTELGRQLSTKDVTTQVADVNSRVTSAKESISRLRLLFARAEKVGEIIAIENELSRREADLESLQAQQRTLAAQTEMARVTVDMTTVAPPAEKKKQDRGFIGGIKRGWDNFTDATVSVLTGLGIVGPFVVFLAVLGAAGAVLLRRRRDTVTASSSDIV